MYDRIVLPTDGTRASMAAAKRAVDLAVEHDAVVHAVHVVETGDGTLDPSGATRASVAETGTAYTDRVAAIAAERGVEVSTAVLRGTPADQIIRYAEAHAADLVVMGTYRKSALERFLWGSVPDRVSHGTDVPVMTVRIGDHEAAVTTPDEANELARRQLERRGFEDVDFPEPPSRQDRAWVARARADGRTFNVHVDNVSGQARLVPVG